jgi:hypothetical protein
MKVAGHGKVSVQMEMDASDVLLVELVGFIKPLDGMNEKV